MKNDIVDQYSAAANRRLQLSKPMGRFRFGLLGLLSWNKDAFLLMHLPGDIIFETCKFLWTAKAVKIAALTPCMILFCFVLIFLAAMGSFFFSMPTDPVVNVCTFITVVALFVVPAFLLFRTFIRRKVFR